MSKMSQEDKYWLIEDFPRFIGRTLMKDTLKAYYKAEMLLHGWDEIKRRGCSCSLRSLKEVVEWKYKTWLHEHKLSK
jgi:hypothetical protein